jgi:hypothetical protein
VWFTSAAQPTGSDDHGGTQAALPGGHDVALPSTSATAMAVSAPGVTGGASDRW